MLTVLLALGLLTPSPVEAASRQFPVEVRLEPDRLLTFGEEVAVRVRTLRDGYLLVLHAEPGGRVRVLFPLDPLDDHYVRGAREYEIVGRGDRPAFRVHAESGVGTVVAAYSPDPFRTAGLIRGDHWDYRLDVWTVEGDPEAHLTALAGSMTSAGEFEYDLVRYDVAAPVAYAGGHHYASGVYGSSYGYHPYFHFAGFGLAIAACGPSFFYPSYCYPFLYRSYFYGYPYGFGYYRGGFLTGGRHDRFRSSGGRSVGGPFRFKDRYGAAPRDVIRTRDRAAPSDVTGRRRVAPQRVPTFDRAPPARRGAPSSWRRGGFPSRRVTPMRGGSPIRAAPPRSWRGRPAPVRTARPTRRR